MNDKIKNISKVGKSCTCTVVNQNSGNQAGAKIPVCIGLNATSFFERWKEILYLFFQQLYSFASADICDGIIDD